MRNSIINRKHRWHFEQSEPTATSLLETSVVVETSVIKTSVIENSTKLLKAPVVDDRVMRRSEKVPNENGRGETSEMIATRILKGEVVTGSMPRPPLRMVRVVLASNYSDFKDERECFWSDVCSEVQNYCHQYGAELFVIDPFQGSKLQDISDSSHDFDLLLREIVRSKELSTGVFFMAYLGDKYGPCCLPLTIKSDEFGHIRTSAFEAQMDVKLLDEWYKLDQNNSGQAVFQLQKTSAKGKPIDANIVRELVRVVQRGAKNAYQEGLINQVIQLEDNAVHEVNVKTQDRYYTCGMEYCLQAAMANRDDYGHCLVVLRKFTMLNTEQQKLAVSDGSAQSNVRKSLSDIVEYAAAQQDYNPVERLSNLKNWVSSNLDKPNIEAFLLPINPEQTSWDRKCKEKQKYMERFVVHVSYKLKQLIDKNFTDLDSCNLFSSEADSERRRILSEAWTHLDFALNCATCSNLLGRKDLISKIGEHCRQVPKKRVPVLVLRGDDGCGKTALLAELLQQSLPAWLKQSVVLCRFIGLTPASLMTHELLRGLCFHISFAYGLEIADTYRTMFHVDKLCEWFNVCLEAIKTKPQPLVILIDDFHQLKIGHNTDAKGKHWLPSLLPQNVIVIVTVSQNTNVDTTLPTRKTEGPVSVLNVEPVSDSTYMDILKGQLAKKHRTLTSEQTTVLSKCLKQSRSLVFCSVLARDASIWQSGYSLNGHGIPSSLSGYFDNVLANLETRYGLETVAFCCCYIECMQFGITETELLDLLTINTDICAKLYPDETNNANNSSVGDVQRFPAMTWVKLKNELAVFLEEFLLDERLLLRWKHSTYSNCVRHRYLSTSLQIKRVHNDIAELLYNVYGEPDITAGGISTNPNVQRLIFPQQLRVVSNRDQERFNYRRISELWYHLLHAANIDLLKEQALCNFEMLQALLDAKGLAHLLTVFESTMLQILHYDFHILYNTVLDPCLDVLSKDNLLLAGETIGRLRYTKDGNSNFLNNLVEQAMTWVDNYSASPLLVPLTCWLTPPKAPLALSFQIQDWKPAATIVQPTLNYQHVLVTGAKDNGSIRMYHVASQTLVKTFEGHLERVLCICLSHSGQFFVTAGLAKSVRVWDLLLGTMVKEFWPHLDKVLCMVLTKDDKYLFTGCADASAKQTDMETGKVMRSFDSHGGPVLSVALNTYGEILVTGSADFTVKMWNVSNGNRLNGIGGLMAPVNQICISTNDAFLLISCEDETLHVCSLVGCQELHELRGHDGKACAVDIAHDDCLVFVGSSDGYLYMYDIHDGKLLDKRLCSKYPVTSVRVTSDSHFLFTASADLVHVWNVEKRDCKQIALVNFEEANLITSIAISSDGKYSCTGSFLGYLQMWDLELCVCLWSSVHNPQQKVTALTFSSDALYIVSGTDQGQAFVWNAVTGSLVRHYAGHRCAICYVVVYGDSSKVASLDSANTVHVWSLQEQQSPNGEDQPIFTFKGAQQFIGLSSGDRELVSKSSEFEKEARIWTLTEDGGVLIKSKPSHVDAIVYMTTSRDGRLLVTTSKDQSLKVWEIASGFITQVLVGHSDTVTSCAISDDGQTVASGSLDRQVIAWEVNTGSSKISFKMHTKPVTAVAITSDASIALAGGEDGWIYCWSIDNGSLFASFNAHRPIVEMLITADAGRIVLRLERCPRLPILCLHNSPAGLHVSSHSRKMSRNLSVSSSGSGVSHSSSSQAAATTVMGARAGEGGAGVGNGPGTTGTSGAPHPIPAIIVKGKARPMERKGSKIFAHLERSRSRASLYGDNPTVTTRVLSDKVSSSNGTSKSGKAGANAAEQRNGNSLSSVCSLI